MRLLKIAVAVLLLAAAYTAGRLIPNDQHQTVIICGNLDDRRCTLWDDITP